MDLPLAWKWGLGSLAAANDAGVSIVDLTSGAWSALGTESVTLIDIPDGVGPSASFTEFAATDSASSVGNATTNYNPAYVDGGVQQATFPNHPGYGDFAQVEADYATYHGAGESQIAIADRVSTTTPAAPSVNETIDLADALPAITQASLDATNPSQPNVTWTSAASLASAAATFVQLGWFDPVADAGYDRTGTWTLVMPASQTSVVPPQIPGATGFGPNAQAGWSDDYPVIVTFDGDAFPTYDAVRAIAAQLSPTLTGVTLPVVPPLPANGRARTTAYFPNAG